MAELQLRGTEVAAAIGMTQGSFSRRFTGSAAWELDELEMLEAKVGISVAYLLGWEPAPEQLTTGAIVIQQRTTTTAGAVPQFRPASAAPPAQPAAPPAAMPSPAAIEPPAEDPPAPPQLMYPDHSPVRFDAGAWPVPSRQPAGYPASA